MKNLIRTICFVPLSWLYGAVVALRAYLYRAQFFKSSKFDIPTIGVGNLSAGGAGKSPHIEYLIRLLSPYIEVATLSRGYGRRTEGFRIVETDATAADVGDEPLQFKRKFPNIVVAVGEKRAYAIPQILYYQTNIQTILLDDVFQHLAVTPYINIILTEFKRPFFNGFLLPYGYLRESRAGAKRADVIIVTKCPPSVSPTQRQDFVQKINPLAHQQVFFSYYKYSNLYSFFNQEDTTSLDLNTNVLLVCAIANIDYLQQYVTAQSRFVHTLQFNDHRLFTNYDVAQMKTAFDNLDADKPQHGKTVIVTTEKDATRLDAHREYITQNQMPIYILPVEVAFLFDEKDIFDNYMKQKLLSFKI